MPTYLLYAQRFDIIPQPTATPLSRDFMDKNTLIMDRPGYLGASILSHPSSL